MNGIKTKVGAGATLAALGGLAAYALGSGDQPAAVSAAKTQPVEIRTQTIRQTVRVVKREKPHPRRKPHGSSSAGSASRRAASAAAPAAAATVASAAPPVSTSHVTTRSSGSAAAPAPVRHVTTRSSGSAGTPATTHHVTTRSSGAGGGEHEHEGGGDD